MTNSADPDQLASLEANWSGSTLFAKTGHVVFSKRRVKGSIFYKKRHFLLQERFSKLIYGINTIIKCGTWQPVKFLLVSHMKWFFSSPEQCSGRTILLPTALALASASTKVKVFVKVFKTSLFPNLIIDLIHLWYDDTYWSKILHSIIPTTVGHVKVKVTDLEFSC